MLAVGLTVLGTSARAAIADSQITEPSNQPHHVELGAENTPKPFTVTASGFPAGSLVYVEQCDGKAPTSENWKPTANCDAGSSPAAAIVDDQGVATFPADDRNKAFHPFVGQSPQELFNCVPEGETPPENGLPTFADCKLRVSSNNFNTTADQVFLDLALPASSGSNASDDSSSSLLPIVVGVVAALAVIAAGWWFLARRRHAESQVEDRTPTSVRS
jgi:hypothetical protein